MFAEIETNTLRLLLRPKEAAQALGMCKRTLDALTEDGAFSPIRVGRKVLYYVDDLRKWIETKKATC